jgi:hypothetical protein
VWSSLETAGWRRWLSDTTRRQHRHNWERELHQNAQCLNTGSTSHRSSGYISCIQDKQPRSTRMRTREREEKKGVVVLSTISGAWRMSSPPSGQCRR